MDHVTEKKAAMVAAERELRFADLRRQWLERRLLEAHSEQEFTALLAELSALEDRTAELGLAVIRTRAEWARASDDAHAGTA